jgi:hypothetical protein
MFISAIALVAMGGAAWAVDGGSGGNGHNWTSAKGTCAKCHVPHGGTGAKIWAQPLSLGTFGGVHKLCNSCHQTDGFGGAALSGNSTVFTTNYQNHSMLTWANTTNPSLTINGWPLDTADTDTIWTVATPDTGEANTGFYCGTCHNVHKQPTLDATLQTTGNGDYLRVSGTQTVAAFGASGVRKGACTQCHTGYGTTGVATGHESSGCMVCHDPHKGVEQTADTALIAEKILTVTTAGNTFTALPNIPAWTANSYGEQIAAACYGCHKTGGVASGKDLDPALEHHQMSTMAATGHAPGVPTFTANNFTCTNCHDMHDGTQDLYLKTHANGGGSYTLDGGSGFCTSRCHNNKTRGALGTAESAHNYTNKTVAGAAESGCFMCHFIHDGTDRGTSDVPNTKAMIRTMPSNYAGGLLYGDADVLDYEDICFGCHYDSAIVGAFGSGARLQDPLASSYFTHRFSGTASAAVYGRMANLPYAVAGTTGGGDYGATASEMYCGTCHNVHVQNTTSDVDGQMFRVRNNVAGGVVLANICVECHTQSGMSGATAHPTVWDSGYDILLPSTRTVDPVGGQFGTGGSGYAGGRTGSSTPGTSADVVGNMSCETCHNFHVSSSNLYGSTLDSDPAAGNNGKLLIMNNLLDATGSTMCRSCHGDTRY